MQGQRPWLKSRHSEIHSSDRDVSLLLAAFMNGACIMQNELSKKRTCPGKRAI